MSLEHLVETGALPSDQATSLDDLMHKPRRNLRIMKRTLKRSIMAILENGRRLLREADYLQFGEPPATAYFLTMIAQEEFAKAFLLDLVRRRIVPWNFHILHASRDHPCKQLLCLIMDYLNPDIDEFIERCNAAVLHGELRPMPKGIADAINILRYEKIGRWESRGWVWAEEPDYDRKASSIGEGKHDRLKQDAIYVRLGSNGQLVSSPVNFSGKTFGAETDRAERLAQLVERMLEESTHPGLDYDKVESALRLLFTSVQQPAESDD